MKTQNTHCPNCKAKNVNVYFCENCKTNDPFGAAKFEKALQLLKVERPLQAYIRSIFDGFVLNFIKLSVSIVVAAFFLTILVPLLFSILSYLFAGAEITDNLAFIQWLDGKGIWDVYPYFLAASYILAVLIGIVILITGYFSSLTNAKKYMTRLTHAVGRRENNKILFEKFEDIFSVSLFTLMQNRADIRIYDEFFDGYLTGYSYRSYSLEGYAWITPFIDSNEERTLYFTHVKQKFPRENIHKYLDYIDEAFIIDRYKFEDEAKQITYAVFNSTTS